MKERPPIWRVAANILNKQSRTADKGWSSSLVMSRDQNAGRSQNMRIDNRSSERVEEFKYLGTTLTNTNSVQE